MKTFASLIVLLLFAFTASGSPMLREETEAGDPCNLTGTYQAGTDISSCSTITVGSLTVPAGVTLDLSKAKDGATINFTDSSAGNGLAQNTDGFDMTKNDHVTITGNKIYNQDDCLAMQSSTNTIFSNNLCSGSHGISVGSIGGAAVDQTTTVSGLTVQGNTITNSDNGLRIKTLIGMKGLVTNVKYINNQLNNVKNAIAIHSDYSRSTGAYTGAATSLVTISDITVDGLTGSAGQIYDIVVNPSVVSGWTFKGITVNGAKGSCKGQPAGITC
uniref:endo-polygalacturonase n=1 Tax=Phytophthora capsici TaxID=4784 RepID=T1NXF0_PHYCP|nr:polygalacturonase [Phytophthora capsici]